MRIQDTLQYTPLRTSTQQANTLKFRAQDVDGTTVQRLKGVSARDGAVFHERFLRREERCVEFALGRGEGAVYREGTCCVDEMGMGE